MMEIDAIIPWVDGSDPALAAKLHKYARRTALKQEDVAAPTRYANLGEIFWCVASLNKFAPWFHKIYIITDNQDPGIEPFLKEHFPEGHIPVEIIDHKVIFRGYEQFLPVFNSLSIEIMKHRIPGLSERFVAFNDDFMLVSPVSPTDFFTEDGKVVCYADRYFLPWVRFTRAIKRRKNDGEKPVTFKGTMMNSADLLGEKWLMLHFRHTPRAALLSSSEKMFAAHPEAITETAKYRFRNAAQYNSDELQFLWMRKEGLLTIRPVFKYHFYLKPKEGKRKGYVEYRIRKLARKAASGSCKFFCLNSFDMASESDRRLISDTVNSILGL